ncbi:MULTISPECIES: class F sortase [Micromonospora]|uniref:Class F sortase n=1 Tax=Micromonospora solifontis TaxID=2487138 RepID=A0ABX9WJI6_9ACTN|nr:MULTISPECIES: class F sortase [Micromonospora]NES14105.1 class F sortase [Micromonospora sp. PPF5-17B]NES35735.1 class F sortase [Micromonospora solifontis]NES56018.1 class F sortase [Micromonospora sp. PPF5-6]RNM00411.1 class F sortase [Micromonospora solifontis]
MTVRDRGALAAMAAGAAALTVATLVACGSRPAEDVGADEAAALAGATPTRTASAAATGDSAGVPVNAGALPAGGATIPPVRLRIPAIGVTATVDPVGVNQRTDEFEVPPSVDRVGWYRYGPGLEADGGSVVIAGHVDAADQGEGAFFRLRELDRGDTVTATGDDGRERRWRVVAREEYAKTKIPLDRYFARDGSPRLTLITCGGPFDAKTRHYRDNIVVTAVPA